MQQPFSSDGQKLKASSYTWGRFLFFSMGLCERGGGQEKALNQQGKRPAGPKSAAHSELHEALRGGVEFTPVPHHPVQLRMAISLRKFKTSHAVKSRRPLITAQEVLHRVFKTGQWINDQFGVKGNRMLKRKAKLVASDYVLSKQKGCICVPLRMCVQKVHIQYISQGDDGTFCKKD